MSLSPDVADLAAAERAEAARRAFSRAESRGRVKTLTVVNLIGLMFAVIGAIGETNAASFMFPQIWGLRTPVGAVIGVLVVIALLTVAGGEGDEGRGQGRSPLPVLRVADSLIVDHVRVLPHGHAAPVCLLPDRSRLRGG
ncbi:hypothetical protein [Microbacterium sp. NPDC090003]|uniref:hypothetical protein n=1 Tax=Microbacterium sp. NPDC090003 TaxID=3364203 RepID=UPI00381ED0A7